MLRSTTLCLTLLLGLAAASCGDSSSDLSDAAADIVDGDCVESTGDKVTVYSGRTENLISPILEAFSCETGIDHEVKWGSSTELAVLIDEEGDNTLADVFLSRSPGPVGFLESSELLGTIDDDVLALIDEPFRSATGSWVGFSGRQRVLVYNVDEVTEDELPATVFDLTDERYEDRVALPATNGSFQDWFTIFRDEHGTETATQWLDDMVANGAKFYSNNRAIVEAAGRGEVDMGLVNHYYNYQEAAARGDDHRAENHSFDKDDVGSVLIVSTAALLDSSEQQAEGNDLIRYLLSPQAQTYFAEETFEYPLAAGVEPVDELPALDAVGSATVDFDTLGGGFEETERIIADSGILEQ